MGRAGRGPRVGVRRAGAAATASSSCSTPAGGPRRQAYGLARARHHVTAGSCPATAPRPALGRVVEQGLGLAWTVHGRPRRARPRRPRRASRCATTPGGRSWSCRGCSPSTCRSPPAAAVDAAARLAALVAARPGRPARRARLVRDRHRPRPARRRRAAGRDLRPHHPPARPGGRRCSAGFEEEHSHATGHVLQPRDPGPLADPDRPLVLVDDELTTGTTALNTLAALPPRDRFVVATLLDLRPAAARAAFAERAERAGRRRPGRRPARRRAARAGRRRTRGPAGCGRRLAQVPAAAGAARAAARSTVLDGGWPAGRARRAAAPAPARPSGRPARRARRPRRAGSPPRLGGRTLVVGTEELMRVPVRLAALLPGDVVVQSTTRSPVLPADLPGYAVRRALLLPRPRRARRAPRGCTACRDAPYDAVVLVVDAPPAGRPLAEALRPGRRRRPRGRSCADRSPPPARASAPTTRPRSPGCSPTCPGVALEVPTEDREELIQGGRHYAEMLPVEYQPDAAYTALFHRALAASAPTGSPEAVGLVGELLLAEHGGPPGARVAGPGRHPRRRSCCAAGTPGRTASTSRTTRSRSCGAAASTTSPSGTCSPATPPRDVRFVDGWTGKGAIARELAAAVAAYPGLDPRLAVLADPGSCTDLFGTRDDFLIPSRLPQLHRQRPGLAHGPARRPHRPGHVPRRQALRRARPRRRVGRRSSTPSATRFAPVDAGPLLPPTAPRPGRAGRRCVDVADAVRHRRRQPRQARRRRDDPGAAAPGAVAGAGAARPRGRARARAAAGRGPRGAGGRGARPRLLLHRADPARPRDADVLVAVDLDQTVVFSERVGRARPGPSVVVEHLDGAPLSSMTVGRVRRLRRPRRAGAASCRSPPARSRSTRGSRCRPPAPHAVCANGGVLLVDGARDPAWDAWVRGLLARRPRRSPRSGPCSTATPGAPGCAWSARPRTCSSTWSRSRGRRSRPAGWTTSPADARRRAAGRCRCRGARPTPSPRG